MGWSIWVTQGISLPEYHKDMIKSYGIADYIELERVKQNLPHLKIAILERGFAGAEEGGNLPEGTIIVNQYDEEMIAQYDLNPGYDAPPVEEAHGRRVAQLVWAMTGMKQDIAPQFYLLNANGYTNFRRAVRYAIQEKIDIIVYAQNWEYGGNFDGKGFVNATVNEALEAGITWINAAGNYGGAVYNGKIDSNKEGNVIFNKAKHTQNKDKLFFTMKSDDKDVRVLCVWNDFSDDRDYQAVKDLDLYVYEWTGNELGELVGQSRYAQVEIPATQNAELADRQPSQLAREEVSLTGLRKDHQYAIMVRNVSENFGVKDCLRIIVHANNGVLTFDDHTDGGEIMIPADNKGVISVGDLSENSSVGPTADFRRKPEVILSPWMAEGQTNVYSEMPYAVFSDDTVVAGTSADAAIFAGMVAVLKANKPSITRTEILQFAGKRQAEWISKRVEIVEPEYTVTESTPSEGETQPVIVEREIVTVYANPIVPPPPVVATVGIVPAFFVTPPPPPIMVPQPRPVVPPPYVRHPVPDRKPPAVGPKTPPPGINKGKAPMPEMKPRSPVRRPEERRVTPRPNPVNPVNNPERHISEGNPRNSRGMHEMDNSPRVEVRPDRKITGTGMQNNRSTSPSQQRQHQSIVQAPNNNRSANTMGENRTVMKHSTGQNTMRTRPMPQERNSVQSRPATQQPSVPNQSFKQNPNVNQSQRAAQPPSYQNRSINSQQRMIKQSRSPVVNQPQFQNRDGNRRTIQNQPTVQQRSTGQNRSFGGDSSSRSRGHR